MVADKGLIRCLLCECLTIESSLEMHLKFNHLVYKDMLVKFLYNLHYPPVTKKVISSLMDVCENEMNDKSLIQNSTMSPFNKVKGKRAPSLDSGKGKGKSVKKRSLESCFEKNKRIKSEESPLKSKKPIRLKKTVHPRKKLQPNNDSMLEEDVASPSNVSTPKRQSRNGVNYDDVYTRKEMSEKQTSAIQKIRQLQANDISCIMDSGTYVQCCDCQKWRLVRDIEDPSLVPEYWICSMNPDESANECSKGEGEHVESDDELVGVEYSCGSLVWIKFPGYPWWPGMVDYCPELEETFLIDETSDNNEASKYHVVFFDKPTNVARSWMEKEYVMKLSSPDSPPKPPVFKNDTIKKRYTHAKSMAVDAFSLPIIERIEKYSFASLFTGKWGDMSDDSEALDQRTPQIDIDARLIGIADFKQPPSAKKTPEPKKVRKKIKKLKERRFNNKSSDTNCLGPEFSAESSFICLKCSAETKPSRTFVENHIRKHRLTLSEYLDKYDTPENKESLVNIRLWVQNQEYLCKISEVAERRRSRSGSQDLTNDDITDTLLNEDNIEETLMINNPRTVTPDEAKSKTDDKIVDEIPVETKTEPLDGSETGLTSLPFSTSSLLVTDQKTKLYLKPPMSPELLIAIAVRNLDPDKAAGASCLDIVAFLSLHFPYFTDNYEECKDMVRRECGMNSSFETGKENFQMKAEINCGDRIHNYVKNNRDKISRSMLEPEFLDTIIERFVKEDAIILPSDRQHPPFSFKQLTYIALLKIHRRATIEQIVILLKFLFPNLASSGVMDDFRKDFLENIAKCEEIKAEVDKSNITFSLKDDLRSVILDDVRNTAMSNIEVVGASLINEKFFEITLPIFQADK